jgi:GT2 family glycosyltransferase
MAKVSILTPVYADSPDKAQWLGEALQSIAEQTHTDWEVVIIDDGSPVNLGFVQAQFSDSIRFRWLKAAGNQGPAKCRNTAAALATGEALLALDADDRLANPEALAAMVEVWGRDRSKVVYGDLQRLAKQPDGRFAPDRIFELPEYTFNRSLDPSGIIPVTALHSVECHNKAGGWKPELEAGLEDVEYWISVGKAGFCGVHIPHVTLLYRQHDGSRAWKLRRVNRRETEMRNSIRSLHADVYEGRYPMACCPGGGSSPQPVLRTAGSPGPRPTSLDQFSPSETVWVEYTGGREASFGMTGDATGMSYLVQGRGHKLQIHVHDAPRFRRSGRGRDFIVGAAPPASAATAPVPEVVSQPQPYTPPAPKLATVEVLDRQAVQAGVQARQGSRPDELDFAGNLAVALREAGWSLEKIANAMPSELMKMDGIGPARSARLINQARERMGLPV